MCGSAVLHSCRTPYTFVVHRFYCYYLLSFFLPNHILCGRTSFARETLATDNPGVAWYTPAIPLLPFLCEGRSSMPPVHPARRQLAAVAPTATPLSPKQVRFLRLFFQPSRPASALSTLQFDALPARCRAALAWLGLQPHLEPHTARLLEAYYAAGYKPSGPFLGDKVINYEQDLTRAMAIGESEGDTISTILSHIPAANNKNVVQRLLRLNDEPELKVGEKVRLEALRLLLQLKGHLRDDQAAVVQATQIMIHLGVEPAGPPQHEPAHIEIEL